MIFKKKTISLSEHRRIVKHLQEEILRKDKMIDDLKEQGNVVMRTMFREKEKNTQVHMHATKLLEINKQLKSKISEK